MRPQFQSKIEVHSKRPGNTVSTTSKKQQTSQPAVVQHSPQKTQAQSRSQQQKQAPAPVSNGKSKAKTVKATVQEEVVVQAPARISKSKDSKPKDSKSVKVKKGKEPKVIGSSQTVGSNRKTTEKVDKKKKTNRKSSKKVVGKSVLNTVHPSVEGVIRKKRRTKAATNAKRQCKKYQKPEYDDGIIPMSRLNKLIREITGNYETDPGSIRFKKNAMAHIRKLAEGHLVTRCNAGNMVAHLAGRITLMKGDITNALKISDILNGGGNFIVSFPDAEIKDKASKRVLVDGESGEINDPNQEEVDDQEEEDQEVDIEGEDNESDHEDEDVVEMDEEKDTSSQQTSSTTRNRRSSIPSKPKVHRNSQLVHREEEVENPNHSYDTKPSRKIYPGTPGEIDIVQPIPLIIGKRATDNNNPPPRKIYFGQNTEINGSVLTSDEQRATLINSMFSSKAT